MVLEAAERARAEPFHQGRCFTTFYSMAILSGQIIEVSELVGKVVAYGLDQLGMYERGSATCFSMWYISPPQPTDVTTQHTSS